MNKQKITAYPKGKILFGVSSILTIENNILQVKKQKDGTVLFSCPISELRINAVANQTSDSGFMDGALGNKNTKTLLRSSTAHLNVKFASGGVYLAVAAAIVALAFGLWLLAGRRGGLLIGAALAPLAVLARNYLMKEERNAFSKSYLYEHLKDLHVATKAVSYGETTEMLTQSSIVEENAGSQKKLYKFLILPVLVLVYFAFILINFLGVSSVVAIFQVSLGQTATVYLTLGITTLLCLAFIVPIHKRYRKLKNSPETLASLKMQKDNVAEVDKERVFEEYRELAYKEQGKYTLQLVVLFVLFAVVSIAIFLIGNAGFRVNPEESKTTANQFVAYLNDNQTEDADNMFCQSIADEVSTNQVEMLAEREVLGIQIESSDFGNVYQYTSDSSTQLVTYKSTKLEDSFMVVGVARNPYAEHCVKGVYAIDIGSSESAFVGQSVGNVDFMDTYDPYNNTFKSRYLR